MKCLICFEELDENSQYGVCSRCREEEEVKMGKICPQCGSHLPDETLFHNPLPTGCQHEFSLSMDNLDTSGTSKKWRCNKCLEVRYTND